MSDKKNDNFQNKNDADISIKERPKNKVPKQYRVVLLNDDYTPMDFVVFILINFFNKSEDEAIQIMFQVHHEGSGICGVYSYEIAETKVMQVMETARLNQHPLQCIMESVG